VPITGTISDAVPSGQYVIGLYIPTIDNSIVYLQASQDGVTNWARILKSDGSADWNVAVSTGNKWIFLDQMSPFTYLRIECAAAQNTAARQFIFVFKPNIEGNV
jgi:hypothetical protein